MMTMKIANTDIREDLKSIKANNTCRRTEEIVFNTWSVLELLNYFFTTIQKVEKELNHVQRDGGIKYVNSFNP